MPTFFYSKCCVDITQSEVDALRCMIRDAKPISYASMFRNCADLLAWAAAHGYAMKPNDGLILKHDPAVTYFRSQFNTWPCYFLVHSGIEYIWSGGPRPKSRSDDYGHGSPGGKQGVPFPELTEARKTWPKW